MIVFPFLTFDTKIYFVVGTNISWKKKLNTGPFFRAAWKQRSIRPTCYFIVIPNHPINPGGFLVVKEIHGFPTGGGVESPVL